MQPKAVVSFSSVHRVVCSTVLLAGLLFPALGSSTSPAARSGIFASTVQVATQTPTDVTTLETGKTIERKLAGNETHKYQLNLAKGQYAKVTVEQRGVDVVVDLFGPDSNLITEFQDEIRSEGKEEVEIVAEVDGDYMLSVKAALPRVASGSYRVGLAETRAAKDDDRSLQESRKLRTESGRLFSKGKYDEARPLLERALALAEGSRGPKDVYVATLASELAGVYGAKRDYANAEAQYQRVLPVLEAVLGAAHPRTAYAKARLAAVYELTGERVKSEKLIQTALAASEKALGPEHPQVAQCLTTLGSLRFDAADFEKAEELERRAIAIMERTKGNEDTLLATLQNNLGMIYLDREDFDHADQLFKSAMQILETVEGPESSDLTPTLVNLGIIAREKKDYPKAEEYYWRSLAIMEKTKGPEHRDVAAALNNIGNLYRAKGDYAKSLEIHLRALKIVEKAAGPYNRLTFIVLGNIARTYAAMGDVANAAAFQSRVDSVLEKETALNLAIGSERQKLLLLGGDSERTDRTISLDLNLAHGSPQTSALAALVLLQRKGRVLDAMSDTLAALRQRFNEDDRALLDQRNQTTAQLARLVLNGPQNAIPAEYEKRVKTLEDSKEQLESTISEHSAEFRAQSQPLTLQTVQAAIPSNAVLVEFAVFRPFDPKAERNSEAYGEPHYAVYVLRKQGVPRGKDLGSARAIDARIAALRQALRDPKHANVKQLARALDERIMRPARGLIGDARHLLISPDGQLDLIPFEALADERGRYLVSRYSISYLTTGRDLLRMRVVRASKSEPIIVANPFFGEPQSMQLASLNQPKLKRALGMSRRSVTSGEDLSSVYFAPLAGTAQEARTIKSLFPESSILTGSRATKSTLKQANAPSILHIATHGFFLTDATGEAAESNAPTSGSRAINASVKIENPLLRSGLALAGANLTRNGNDNGILTALEASNLNLWGTKLVTLSACDTGIGEVKNGEGVYGLRRAFFLAGAETLVMSLWPVSDYTTREMMTTYYSGLRHRLGRGEALRQAQLSMLKRKGRQHPFYWASFIQSGEWANLDGKR